MNKGHTDTHLLYTTVYYKGYTIHVLAVHHWNHHKVAIEILRRLRNGDCITTCCKEVNKGE